MRLIKQGDNEGCGLACVAMLSGTSYAAVRNTYRAVTKTNEDDPVKPTDLRLLKQIMEKHGIVIEGRMRRIDDEKHVMLEKLDNLDLDCDTLLKVNPREGGRRWHWVIWDHRRRRVLDPKVPPYKKLKRVGYWRLGRMPIKEE